MRNIVRNANGVYTVVLHLKRDEKKQLKKLSEKLNLNDFDAIRYCIQLVAMWSRNKIEPEE